MDARCADTPEMKHLVSRRRTGVCLAILACSLALEPGPPAGAEETDDLQAIMNAPNAEELASRMKGLVTASDHNGIWAMSIGPAAAHLGEDYGEWLIQEDIPLEMRMTVAIAAGQMRSRTAVPGLLRWLGDKQTIADAFFRECILYALGQIGDKRAATAVKAFETHADEWTRFFAKEAGARIAGKPEKVTPRWSKTRMNLVSANLNWWFGKMVADAFQGAVKDVRGKPMIGELMNEGLAFDDHGEPRFDIALLCYMSTKENSSTPFMLWRLYHYARRGGQVIIDAQFLYWICREYEMIGEGDSAIQGNLKGEYRYQRGPWDELYPEKLEKNPTFPPLDDQAAMFKDFYYGYRRIGRGGCLLMSEVDQTLEFAIKNIPACMPVRYWEIPNSHALHREIFAWLKDGPEHRPASVGWRNEALKPQPFYAGAATHVLVSLLQLQAPPAPIVPEVKMFAADGRLVASAKGKSVVGKTGAWALQEVALEVPILTLPRSDYRLEIAALDKAGKVLHRMERTVAVRGRFEMAMEGWPTVLDREALVPAKLRIKDTATGPYPPLQARLSLINEDFDRVYRTWRAPWNSKDDIAMGLQIPEALPSAQYALRVELVDDKEQVYGMFIRSLARQAVYEQRRIFQWSEWTQSDMGAIAENLHKVGINTTAGNGAFHPYPGFPYDWMFDTTDVFVQPSCMGDHYLKDVAGKYKHERVGAYRFKKPDFPDPGQPHGTTHGYGGLGAAVVNDARKVSLDMLEESKMQDLSWGYNYMLQLEYMLQEVWRTVENLNQSEGSDFLSWDELPFATFKTGFGWSAHEGGWVFFTQRSETLKVRSLAIRENNPYLRIEAGANNLDWFYDGLHSRFYDGNLIMPALWLLREIPSHPRAAKTWLMDFKNDYTVAGQARKIWAAIAGNGRHITLFQSGGHFSGDGAWWWGLTTLSEAIHSVRPYEPILIDTRNRLSPDIAVFGTGGSAPAVHEMPLALGILPEVIQAGSYMARIEGEKNFEKYRIIIDGNHNDIKPEQLAALRRAVENGAILIAAPGSSPAVAAEFGVEAPDQKKRGAVKRIALEPLAKLLPGVAGAWLYGQLGPATAVTPKSGLTMVDGLIFGQVGKGLYIYVNLESENCGLGGRSGDDSPWDYEGWARLWLALLERQGLARDVFRVVDSAGRTDRRFVCRILDTDDGLQRYVLVQANNVLEGSLSNWNLDAREPQALARFAPPKPVTFKAGMAPVTLKWKQQGNVEGQVWIRRRVRAAPGKPEYTLSFDLTRNGKKYDPAPPGLWGVRPGGACLRAEIPTDGFVWEAAGPTWELWNGEDHEATFKGGEREVEVDRIVVLPAIATARLVIADPRIVSLYDVKDDRSYPVVETKGLRHVDVPVQAGRGVVLGLGEAPAGKFVARLAGPEVGRGGSLRVDCEVQGPAGKPLARSATLLGTLRRGPKNEPVPNSAQHRLVEGGNGIFEYWILATEPEGPATLDLLNMATGQRVELPLTIRDAGEKNNPHGVGWNATLAQRPARHVLTVAPLADLRVPDIGIFDLTGAFANAGQQPMELEFGSAIPDECFPGGRASRRFTAPAGKTTRFSMPVILTRKTARRIQRRDLTIPVWLQTADGKVVVRNNVRLLVNIWDISPPVLNTLLSDGAASLIVANATAKTQTLAIELQPPDGIVVPKPAQRVEVPANKEINVAFLAKPRDLSVSDGHYPIPYRATLAPAVSQEGETRVSVRTLSRWWIGKLNTAPVLPDTELKMDGSQSAADKDLRHMIENAPELEDLVEDAGTWGGKQAKLFQAKAPPANWNPVLHGGGIWLGNLDPLPGALDIVLAATRVWSPDDREVTVKAGRRTVAYTCLDGQVLKGDKATQSKIDKIRVVGRFLLNGQLIYDSRPNAPMPKGPFKLNRGENTLLVQLQPSWEAPMGMSFNVDPGNIFVLFYDAKTGKRSRGLLFDIDKRAKKAAAE